MKGDIIPDHNHVARYCKPTDIYNEQIQAPAFMLRKDEVGLSVNWLEYFNFSSREEEIAEIQKTYALKLKRVSAGAKIGVINVGEVREKVLTESPNRLNLNVIHVPEEIDPSHSEIYNLLHGDEYTAELILETVCETYSARK